MSTPLSSNRGFRFGPFVLDTDRAALVRDGAEVRLRPKSFEVLRYLVEHPGRLVTRDELMTAVWGETVVTEGSLTQCIIDVRRALNDAGQDKIRTVPRRGYIFEPVVTPSDREAEPGAAQPSAPAGPGATVEEGQRVADFPGQRGPGRLQRLAPFAGLAAAGLVALVLWQAADRGGGPAPGESGPVVAPAGSIAVLPFKDMSPGGGQEYFGDGIAEEVLNLLAQATGLKVIARTSSFSLKERADLDVPAIADRLGVQYVLEGSVRRADDRVRITAQLVEGERGLHLWSRTYDRDLGQVLQVQREIAREVADALQATIARDVALDGGQRPDPEAFDRYLHGHFLHSRRVPGDLAKANEYYLESIRLDPGFAKPWAGLAGLYLLQVWNGELPHEEGLALMGNAARTALGLDPGLAEARLRLAAVHALSGNKALAREQFEEALRVDPDNPLALGMLAGWELALGRPEEAVRLQRRAVELDPLGMVNRANLGGYLMRAGRLEEAEAAFTRAQELRPGFPLTRDFAVLRVLQDRHEEAAELVDGLPEGFEKDLLAAIVYGRLGRVAEAEAAVARLEADPAPMAALRLAELHASRGDDAAALDWLLRGRERLGEDPTVFEAVVFREEVGFSVFLAHLRDLPGTEWAFDNLDRLD